MIKIEFVDIHNHILPGVDDGAKNLDESLKLLEEAVHQGITCLLVTPHINELSNEMYLQKIEAEFENLKRIVSEKKWPLELRLGGEYFFDSNLQNLDRCLQKTWQKNKLFLLFELPLSTQPRGIPEFIFHSRLRRKTPILAHPERYIYLQDKPEEIISWARQGCLIQITAGSYLGRYGRRSQQMSEYLLQEDVVDLIASDAHNPEERNFSVLKEAYNSLKLAFDEEKLYRWFYLNPLYVFRNEQMVQKTTHIPGNHRNWRKRIQRWRKQIWLKMKI